jgi:hypothetical protein
MRSQRWIKLVFGFVFSVSLAAAGRAEAQWGYPVYSFAPYGGPYGVGYGGGAAYGVSPYAYGAFPGVSSGIPGQYGYFPAPGYGLDAGEIPQTTTALPTVASMVTLVAGWSGPRGTWYGRPYARQRVRRFPQ